MYIMAGDRAVVEFDEAFNYEILDSDLAPLYIQNRGNIKRWIEERAVDPTRANSRAVKSRLGLSKNAAAYETAMKVDAAAITDNFWVKDKQDLRTYKEIVFRRNDFFSLALYRDFSGLSLRPSRTPELTNIGAQEKGWKLEQGTWWLYKNEPIHEVVSEYLTYRIGQALGYSMAEYDIVENGKFIKTKDFTGGKVNLQHIDSIMVDHMEQGREVPDDDYAYNYSTLLTFSPELAEQYLKLCTLDAICENYDRHTKNYGVLTDQQSGKLLSLAPNYDNNNSLFANYGLLAQERKGGLLREFIRFIDDQGISLDLPLLPEKILDEIFSETKQKTTYEFDEKGLKGFILDGLEKLYKWSRHSK